MPRRPRTPLLASLLAAACIGAGGGAVAYSIFTDHGNTVVRQVTVQNAAACRERHAALGEPIYRRAYRGVVEITVTERQLALRRQTQAQGSGFVYDSTVTSSRTTTSSTACPVVFGQVLERQDLQRAARRRRQVDGSRRDQGRRAGLRAVPARARHSGNLVRSVTAWSRSAAPSGSRRRLRAGSSARCTARSHSLNQDFTHQRLDPDRRRDQPRQLRRPAAERAGPGGRRQRADPQRLGRQRRRRLLDPLEHGQARSPAS